MSSTTISLFRAISDTEWADIMSIGGFRSLPSTMQGHWFATTAAHAVAWGQRLYNQPFMVVEVETPNTVADSLFCLPLLDNIGPARFADDAQLVIINQQKIGPIRQLKTVPGGKP